MKKSKTWALVSVVLSLLSASCSPLGDHVDEQTSNSYFYAKSGSGVVFAAEGNWQKLGHSSLNGVDANSFRPLATVIGVDNARVYYREHPQPHVERASFEVADLVWRDASNVYHAAAGEPLLVTVEEADPASFRYVFPESANPRMWARDSTHVFLDHQPLDVDAASFVFVNDAFVADKDHVYRNRSPLTPVTDVTGPVEALNESHVQMGNQIISGGSWAPQILSFENIENVRTVGPRLVVVNERLFEKGEELTSWDGDVSGLQVFPGSEHYAHDESRLYSLWPSIRRIEGADRASFAPFDSYDAYAVDAQRVYYRGRALDDADRASFEVVTEDGETYARDKRGRFLMGERQ